MARTARRTTKATGDQLERLVASYYEALGFKVMRDCNVDGHQIDLIATKYILEQVFLT